MKSKKNYTSPPYSARESSTSATKVLPTPSPTASTSSSTTRAVLDIYLSASAIYSTLKARNDDFHESAKLSDDELMNKALDQAKRLYALCGEKGSP